MLDSFVFLSLLLITISIGIYKSKNTNTEKAYLLANRSTDLFQLIATLVMTEFNPSTLIGFSSLGYIGGYYSLGFPLVFLIGLLFYTFTVAIKWKQLDGTSISDLFKLRYGYTLGKISSIFLLLAMMGFSANYIKSLEMIFSPITPNVSVVWIGFLMVLISLSITLRGGLLSIIKTDVFGFIITIILFPTIYFFSSRLNFEREIEFSVGMERLPISFILSLIVLTMFTYISAPWYGQKIFSAKDEKIAFKAVGISSILVFILYSFPLLAVYNLYRANVSLQNNEFGITYIFLNILPEGFKGYAFFVVLIAGVTTLSGVWSAMVTLVINDFMNYDESLKTDTKRSILLTLLIAFISFVLAEIAIDQILNKLILANIPVAALSYGLLSAFYWKKSSKFGAFSSLLFGLFWGIFCYIYFGEAGNYTFYWGVIGIPLMFIIGILGSYLKPPNEIEMKMITKFNERMNRFKK